MAKTLRRTSEEVTDIYHRHVDMVYKICFLFMKNAEDAEDVVQSTFIKLMEASIVFNDSEHEKAWLIVTAQNQCRNNLKHWWRRLWTDIDSVDNQVTAYETHHDETLHQVLSLPTKYKMPIYLYYYEGYSSKEISIMLSIKESTIRSQLRTGRQLLKIKIGGEACD